MLFPFDNEKHPLNLLIGLHPIKSINIINNLNPNFNQKLRQQPEQPFLINQQPFNHNHQPINLIY
jgi:hypothetical protein